MIVPPFCIRKQVSIAPVAYLCPEQCPTPGGHSCLLLCRGCPLHSLFPQDSAVSREDQTHSVRPVPHLCRAPSKAVIAHPTAQGSGEQTKPQKPVLCAGPGTQGCLSSLTLCFLSCCSTLGSGKATLRTN